MKKWMLLFGLSLLVLLSACSVTPDLPVTPSADKLTFLFFYTEN